MYRNYLECVICFVCIAFDALSMCRKMGYKYRRHDNIVLVTFAIGMTLFLAVKFRKVEKRVHTITKKHYIPESTFNYQKALRKHMQGGVCKLLFYVFWIIKMYTCGKKTYTIIKRD